MDSPSKKVLITGINGFTGKYLSDYLSKLKFNVFGISNFLNDNHNPKTFRCDITNLQEISQIIENVQPQYIIHLAGISFVQHANPEEFYTINVIGTQNLLEACLQSKNSIKKIILASSATVYGNQNEDVLHEEMTPNPNNHYGISKWAMEQISKNYFDRLPIIITRPFNYTAPGQAVHFIIPKIAQAFINKNSEIELGNIDVYREYNSIEFVCHVYHQLLLTHYQSEIINICSGNTYSIKEIIELFVKYTGHQIEVKKNLKFVRENDIVTLSGNPKKLYSIIQQPSENSINNIIKSFF